MKFFWRPRVFAVAFWLALLAVCSSCVPQRQAERRVGGDDSEIFYEDLAPYGRWVNHAAYGRVWYPEDVPLGWRPYTDGHWEYSRDYGWVWASDREWGWAPFHYGRWAFDDWYGWVWVPGREWAPAWVVWRYGGGYAAWAPMPPTAVWLPGRGLDRRYFRHERDLRWDCWVGVPERHLRDRQMHRHIIGQRDNMTVINRATTVVQVVAVDGRVVNQGVPVGYLEKATGEPVPRVHLHEVDRPEARDDRQGRDSLRVVHPRLRAPSAEDVRRDDERARAASQLADQQEQEHRRDGTAQGQPEPRKAGRLAAKGETPEAQPPVGQQGASAPLPDGKEQASGASSVQQASQPQAAERKEPASLDAAVAPAAPQAGERGRQEAEEPRPAGIVTQEDDRRKGSGNELAAPSQPAPPAPAAVPPPVAPEARAVPSPAAAVDSGAGTTAVPAPSEPKPQPEPQPEPRQSAPAGVASPARQDTVHETVAPPVLKGEPVREGQADQQLGGAASSRRREPDGGRERRRMPPEPQVPVVEPVRAPEPPVVQPPPAPALPPEVMPGGERPRRDHGRGQPPMPAAQPVQESVPPRARPEPEQAPRVEVPPVQPPGGPEGQPGGKRKKPRQPGEGEEQEDEAAAIGQPRP